MKTVKQELEEITQRQHAHPSGGSHGKFVRYFRATAYMTH